MLTASRNDERSADTRASDPCGPPQFGGSPATLSYRWIFNFKTISRKQTIVATNAMAGHRVGCHVTALNAGGRFTDSSPKVGDLLIGR